MSEDLTKGSFARAVLEQRWGNHHNLQLDQRVPWFV